jgi:hypothetical protein
MQLPAVGMQSDGDFANARAQETGLDDHLGGKFHPAASLVQLEIERLRESAKPAVNVVDRRPKPPAGDPRKHRIAKPAVEAWHRTREDASTAGSEPATLHKVAALAQALDQRRKLAEVVALVGVAHHDEVSASGLDSSHERRAVPTLGNRHNASALRRRNLSRTVRAPVVRNDDLAGDARLLHRRQRLPDACRKRVRFVEARHHDRELEL